MSLLSCFSSQSSCCLTVEENGSCCRLKVWCFPIGYISWRSQEVHHTAVWVLISSTTFLIEIWTALLRIRINWLCVCMYIQCRVLVFFLDCYGHVKPTSLRKTNSGGCWNVLEMAAPQIHKMKNEARICSCPFQICMHLPPKVVNHWCVLTKSHKITRVSEKSWSWSQKKAVAEIWNLHLLRMLLYTTWKDFWAYPRQCKICEPSGFIRYDSNFLPILTKLPYMRNGDFRRVMFRSFFIIFKWYKVYIHIYIYMCSIYINIYIESIYIHYLNSI